MVVFYCSEDGKDVKEAIEQVAGQDTEQVAGQVIVQELLAYVPGSRQEIIV